MLANERTFSGWARTSLATVGIGLGFNALFGKLEPAWLPRAIATLFVGLGIIIMAERRACAVVARLTAHNVKSLAPLNLLVIGIVYIVGAAALVVGLWTLDV